MNLGAIQTQAKMIIALIYCVVVLGAAMLITVSLPVALGISIQTLATAMMVFA